jgi:hypothetical protein
MPAVSDIKVKLNVESVESATARLREILAPLDVEMSEKMRFGIDRWLHEMLGVDRARWRPVCRLQYLGGCVDGVWLDSHGPVDGVTHWCHFPTPPEAP